MFKALMLVCALGAHPQVNPEGCPGVMVSKPTFQDAKSCEVWSRARVSEFDDMYKAQGWHAWGRCVKESEVYKMTGRPA